MLYTYWEGKNKTVFADDTVIYAENKNQQQLTSEYSKVAGQKVNIQKSVVFPYTNTEQQELEIQNTMLFTLAPQK